MSEFNLVIVTPDGIAYNGKSESVIVRTINGDIGILSGHEPYLAPLSVGKAKIKISGQWRHAACSGGIVSVDKNSTKLAPITFEWADDIDVVRAENAAEKAKRIIDSSNDEQIIEKAQIKLHKALMRLGVANNK